MENWSPKWPPDMWFAKSPAPITLQKRPRKILIGSLVLSGVKSLIVRLRGMLTCAADADVCCFCCYNFLCLDQARGWGRHSCRALLQKVSQHAIMTRRDCVHSLPCTQ